MIDICRLTRYFFVEATVLLHLYLAGLHLSSSRDRAFASGSVDAAASSSSPQAGKNSISNGASTDSTAVTQATGVYVQCQSPFPQVEDFVEEATKKYQVELEVVNAPMKEALKIYKARRESSARPVEAVLVGTRVGDPFAGTPTVAWATYDGSHKSLLQRCYRHSQ